MSDATRILKQTLVGVGVLVLAAVLALGAADISSQAGYSGVGPNFLPWVVAVVLAACGLGLIREARSGGFRHMDEEPEGAEPAAYWVGLAWMSAGLLLNALLITSIGFILSCALCFMLAAQGLRRSRGEPHGLLAVARDAVSGACIAAPVYWMFTQFLAINLPGLTKTGWL
ncbi:MAG: hypothetical protein RLZZ126_1344 [Pseudomonadota bacterium]|jgi:putative tricarboxylic transport membrane protein